MTSRGAASSGVESVEALRHKLKLNLPSDELHGTLEVHIKSCRGLSGRSAVGCGKCVPFRTHCGCLPHFRDLTNPVVEVYVGSECVIKTKNRLHALHPRFKEKFRVNLAHDGVKRVVFRVSDIGSDHKKHFIGQVALTAEDILTQCSTRTGISGKFPLCSKRNKTADILEYAGSWLEDKTWKKETYKAQRKGTYGLGWLKMQLRFTPAQDDIKFWKKRCEKLKKKNKQDYSIEVVPNTYFSPQFGGEFFLYQSAHHPGFGGSLPEVDLANGKVHKARSCWEDLSAAIKAAQKLVCILARNLCVNTHLIRTGNKAATEVTIGQLLKDKAEAGVVVLVLLADLSHEDEDFNEETVQFFRRSKVQCVRRPRKLTVKRKARQKDGLRPDDIAGYLHDQKCVIVDSVPQHAGKLGIRHRRKKNAQIKGMTAFVGNLDVMIGRYDTLDKSLFGLLKTVHHNDFYNGPFSECVEEYGPRQPWQDAQLRISGLAAVDVLKNFIERWLRQVGNHRRPGPLLCCGPRFRRGLRLRKMYRRLRFSMAKGAIPSSKLYDKTLDIFHRAEILILGEDTFGEGEERDDDDDEEDDDLDELDKRDNEIERSVDSNWNKQLVSQVVRSIGERIFRFSSIAEDVSQPFSQKDIHSARFDSKIKFPRLVSRTGTLVDNSLENAYVHYIRSAKHFIYLESQTLIGSSAMWTKQRDSGATNVIPGEIAYKICEKIKQKKKFHAYVVLSMFPQGDPASEFVQQQLYYQFLTLEMIMRKITVQIKLAGLRNKKATDYISLYCLANREAREAAKEKMLPIELSRMPPSVHEVYQKRRMAIHVNSNVLIVDDHLLLCASGGINQRTFDGSRDSSLGVCVFDAAKKVTDEAMPKGDVYGHRMHLFAEHLGGAKITRGGYDEMILAKPSSDTCVKHVLTAAMKNWETFTDDEKPQSMDGHLVPYPVEVDENGVITPKYDYFPDCNVAAKIIGTEGRFEHKLTT